MTTRKTYTPEFKREAVRMAQERGNKSEVARELGIHISVLRRWEVQIEKEGERAFPGKGNPRDEEMYRLQRENARLQEENEILKKAVGVFSSRPR